MPSQLKEELKPQLVKKLAERSKSDLFEKIADETIATSIEDLIMFLDRVKHPALSMKPLV
jgi:CO dehydrogenase/acetyl-CoA synthase beta subunit